MFLAGDIGGTKTAVMLFADEQGLREPIAQRVFSSREFDSLEGIVQTFLKSVSATVRANELVAAAFGIAGPIIHDEARVTNLSWTVNRSRLAGSLNVPEERVLLLNDLEATANAVPRLQSEDVETLNVGSPVSHAPIAVIAPGTGLGQAYLTWDGAVYRPHPSEGGHVDFAPCDQLQLELLNYLYGKYEHVSFERVVSGLGIPEIYQFLRESGRAEEPADLRTALQEANDWTPIIMASAEEYPLCRITVDTFVRILAAKSGNVALALMSRGGVYLGGGIPPRILPELQSAEFLRAFTSKGRFTEMMTQIPLHVILNPRTALLGAAWAALAAP
jgi:glucokinase